MQKLFSVIIIFTSILYGDNPQQIQQQQAQNSCIYYYHEYLKFGEYAKKESVYELSQRYYKISQRYHQQYNECNSKSQQLKSYQGFRENPLM